MYCKRVQSNEFLHCLLLTVKWHILDAQFKRFFIFETPSSNRFRFTRRTIKNQAIYCEKRKLSLEYQKTYTESLRKILKLTASWCCVCCKRCAITQYPIATLPYDIHWFERKQPKTVSIFLTDSKPIVLFHWQWLQKIQHRFWKKERLTGVKVNLKLKKRRLSG